MAYFIPGGLLSENRRMNAINSESREEGKFSDPSGKRKELNP